MVICPELPAWAGCCWTAAGFTLPLPPLAAFVTALPGVLELLGGDWECLEGAFECLEGVLEPLCGVVEWCFFFFFFLKLLTSSDPRSVEGPTHDRQSYKGS